ncbi:fascin domain-containing protein [Streptomyces sp. MAR4 CNX-425]|uniref:fascin domain-containing protein n=1 Tax=Streptomyces sp. MAR4 CNX-425 TaxID=3406343 RepID=UPI003B5112E1
MRRTLVALASLCTALGLSALETAAAQPGSSPAAAPDGWQEVQGTEAAGALGGAPARTAAADAQDTIAIQSVTNGRFTTAEVNYAAPHTGVLRARSDRPGGWETFDLIWDEDTETYALKSKANNRFVAVERNFTGKAANVLRARSTTAGAWERFSLWYNEDLDRWAFRSELNGRFVTMENNYTGSLRYVLRARSDRPGGWEEFALYDRS